MPQAMVSLVCGHVEIFINDERMADKLRKHCTSLRDAMFLTKHLLTPDTTKKLGVHWGNRHCAHTNGMTVHATIVQARHTYGDAQQKA